MFGFVLGTACLIALVVVLSRGRHGRLFGHGRYGYRHGRYGRGPRAALHGLLERLDTGPGQEKVIVGAVEEFVDRARESGRELRDTRRELADAMRGERIDEARLSEVFARHDGTLGSLRTAGLETLRKVHETLDERQRKILADVVESGHFGYGFYGRHAC